MRVVKVTGVLYEYYIIPYYSSLKSPTLFTLPRVFFYQLGECRTPHKWSIQNATWDICTTTINNKLRGRYYIFTGGKIPKIKISLKYQKQNDMKTASRDDLCSAAEPHGRHTRKWRFNMRYVYTATNRQKKFTEFILLKIV